MTRAKQPSLPGSRSLDNGTKGRAPAVDFAAKLYTVTTLDTTGRRDWISIASSGGRAPDLKDLPCRVSIATDFLANVRALITPGVRLVLIDAPVNESTRRARVSTLLPIDSDSPLSSEDLSYTLQIRLVERLGHIPELSCSKDTAYGRVRFLCGRVKILPNV